MRVHESVNVEDDHDVDVERVEHVGDDLVFAAAVQTDDLQQSM